ncbi:hypothetical protein GCM10020331_069410 [Ectobacillus funiculus]
MADYERNNRRLLRDFQTEDEEYAAEVAPARIRNDRREDDATAGGTIVGFISLALAVLSFFTYPVIFRDRSRIARYVRASTRRAQNRNIRDHFRSHRRSTRISIPGCVSCVFFLSLF